MSLSIARMTRQLAIILVLLGVTSGVAKSAGNVDDPPLSFLVGDYTIVGQEPDGGAAYSGSAHIELAEGRLVLKSQRGGHEVTAAGRFEVPSPPGEGRILRFRWQDPEPMLMACLVGSDLDNYPRLTCLWFREGSQPARPGLEAMFPSATWESFKQ
jgi:hypothetical protein